MTWQRALEAALISGAIAGILDIGLAAGINLVSPVIVLKAIASGLLGPPAFSGGVGTITLGLLLQILMSVVIALIYVVAADRVAGFDHPWAGGSFYGLIIFLVMNLVVVPLSAYPYPTKITPYWVLANLAAMIAFGTIVALVVRQVMGSSTGS